MAPDVLVIKELERTVVNQNSSSQGLELALRRSYLGWF